MMITRWYVETHWVIKVVKHSTHMSVLYLIVWFTYFISCLKRLTLWELKMQSTFLSPDWALSRWQQSRSVAVSQLCSPLYSEESCDTKKKNLSVGLYDSARSPVQGCWRSRLCEIFGCFWSEVKCVTVKFLWIKMLCTSGWPYTEGACLYCDYFHLGICCIVFVLICGGFILFCNVWVCVCVGFVMCVCVCVCV